MNLTKLFEMQKVLDERIIKQKGLEGRDTLPEKILALQVELGECANEWRGFKFWSEDREPRFQHFEDYELPLAEDCGLEQSYPLLEEFVDCLHFVLSIGLEIGDTIFDTDDYEIHFEDEAEVSLTEQFITTNWLVGCLLENKIHYEQALFNVLRLGEMLGFTWKQVEQAYFAKNEINHTRQATGY